MPKFSVDLERRFVQMETVTIEVEAKNAAEARKIAKEQMHSETLTDLWEPSDSSYDHYTIDDVSLVKENKDSA